MESIQSAFGELMNGRKLGNKLEDMQRELLSDVRIQEFLQKNTNVTNDMIERSMAKMFEYRSEIRNCEQCPGLEKCSNMISGYQPSLFIDGNRLSTNYTPCSLKQAYDERKKEQELVKSLYIPKEILDARFDQIETDNEVRLEAIHIAFQFATSIKPGEESRGLYLYGKFGVGKTYIMGAVANELKDRNIETHLVYTPDFFREMKQGISDGSFHEKLDRIKRAQVLILDDIGAENMSSWVRDEILGVILQYRMLEKLPTLFTSNYDQDELEEHLAYSDKGGIEELKAKRIMERIRHYATCVNVGGHNRRK
ncbi:primosomal protein DnaI [Bacillus sp. FJAT-45350]|uniref:primosomal protein DnaI n=1 Tax=Bacillus sp. FJAT-45350 TaxID=2011014 RepID=UPI000BB7CBD5|nr:primosomal protein DnaI [Bacillus sp. FJAT-45350]